MATNITTLKQKVAGTFAQDYGGMATVEQATDVFASFTKAAADGMASTTTANTYIGFSNPYDCQLELVSGVIYPAGALTADNSNYANIKILTDDAAAGTPAEALRWDTTIAAPGTGSWVTSVAKMSVSVRTAAACTLVPGAALWFAIAKTGTGVVVPISTYMVRLRRK